MAFFDQFTLPVKGLHIGLHEYQFDINDDFFKLSDTELIESGNFKVNLVIDKNMDMMILNIDFEGFWKTVCDRCTADIDLPITGNNEILIKYADKELDDGDIIYIMKESTELNVAKIILDSIIVGLPIQKTYDCDDEEPRPCDDTVLDRLSGWDDEEEEIKTSTDIWSNLSGLQIDSEE